jgi:hypothetical protein
MSGQTNTGSKPDPDPTVRTTENLLREIANTRETMEADLHGLTSTLEARLAAADKAIVLVREASDKIPALIEAGVRHLKEVDEVKFEAIRDRFSDAKLALDVALQGASKAVDAAFSAAKEAALKIEASFTKQIDQLRDLFVAQQQNMSDQIGDLKNRLIVVESTPRLSADSLNATNARLESISGEKKGSSDTIALIIAVGAAVIAAIAVFVKR